MLPLNVCLPENPKEIAFSGETASCPFINCNKNQGNESLFLHLSLLFEKGSISYDIYSKLRDFIICGDIAVINALYSDIHGFSKPFQDLLQSGFLNSCTDFSYLENLSPLPDYEILFGDDSLTYLSTTKQDSNSSFCNELSLSSSNNFPANYCSFTQFSSYDKSEEKKKDFLNSSSTLSSSADSLVDDPFQSFTSWNYHKMGFENDPSVEDFNSLSTEVIPTVSSSDNWKNNLSYNSSVLSLSSLELSNIPSSTHITERVSDEVIHDKKLESSSNHSRYSIHSSSWKRKQTDEKKLSDKRKQKMITKKYRYDMRRTFAAKRLRVKGRFLKKEDEAILHEYMNLT